jgi:hypothetical protein
MADNLAVCIYFPDSENRPIIHCQCIQSKQKIQNLFKG